MEQQKDQVHLAVPGGEAKSLHTPGPWLCYADLPSMEPHWHIVTNASRRRVLANVHIEPGNEVDAANARLITAAPELLEFAQQLAARGIADKPTMDKCRAAIAKATGAA